MELDFNQLSSPGFGRKDLSSASKAAASQGPDRADAAAGTPAATYAAQGLTVSKREFPLPGEVPENDEVANLPDDLLDRDDALGKLMQRAFNFAPPPPPPFEA